MNWDYWSEQMRRSTSQWRCPVPILLHGHWSVGSHLDSVPQGRKLRRTRRGIGRFGLHGRAPWARRVVTRWHHSHGIPGRAVLAVSPQGSL